MDVSVEPPAVNGTITVIGPCGSDVAAAQAGRTPTIGEAQASPAARKKVLRCIYIISL
ncbi:hypothetical protein GCM10025795_24850 [Verticiella sediminum]